MENNKTTPKDYTMPLDYPEDHYNINHTEYLRENTEKSWYDK